MSRLSQGEVALFARELAGLLRMGYHLPEALVRMKTSPGTSWGALLDQLVKATLAGTTLVDALAASRAFPAMFVRGLAQARDEAETLRTMEHLADMLERDDERRQEVVAALAYPRLLWTGGLLLTILVFAPVLNQAVDGLKGFAGQGARLPLLSVLVFGLARLADSVPGACVLLLAAVAGNYVLSGAPDTTRFWPWIPLLRTRVRRQDSATWCLWMDHLLQVQTPLPEAVRLAADGCMAQPFVERMSRVATRLEKGGSLSDCLAAERALPAAAGWLVQQAERRQFAAGALTSAGHCLERSEVASDQQNLTVVEPICIIFMGLTVGVVVLAYMLPLYQLVGSLH